MSPTVAECLEHVRQCEWYAARTSDEADRKFLLGAPSSGRSWPQRKKGWVHRGRRPKTGKMLGAETA